jgi:type IV pilus assembly protein PilE
MTGSTITKRSIFRRRFSGFSLVELFTSALYAQKATEIIRNRRRGFTLIELLIVIAVVAILTAIAYPSYQAYIKRAHRSAAESLMLDLANREQQYLLDQRSFLGGGASAVTTLLTPNPVPPEVSPYYNMSIAAALGPPLTFTITAAPKSGTIMDGDGDLTLDQAGTKLPADKWVGR